MHQLYDTLHSNGNKNWQFFVQCQWSPWCTRRGLCFMNWLGTHMTPVQCRVLCDFSCGRLAWQKRNPLVSNRLGFWRPESFSAATFLPIGTELGPIYKLAKLAKSHPLEVTSFLRYFSPAKLWGSVFEQWALSMWAQIESLLSKSIAMVSRTVGA